MLDRLLDAAMPAATLWPQPLPPSFIKTALPHAKVANPVLQDKRDLTLKGLEEELGDTCVWSVPVGGLFIWVRLPDDVDRSKLWAMSREQGVAYLPGQSFHYQRQDVPYLRLAFGHLTPDQITTGLPISGAVRICSCRGSNEARNFESLF